MWEGYSTDAMGSLPFTLFACGVFCVFCIAGFSSLLQFIPSTLSDRIYLPVSTSSHTGTILCSVYVILLRFVLLFILANNRRHHRQYLVLFTSITCVVRSISCLPCDDSSQHAWTFGISNRIDRCVLVVVNGDEENKIIMLSLSSFRITQLPIFLPY